LCTPFFFLLEDSFLGSLLGAGDGEFVVGWEASPFAFAGLAGSAALFPLLEEFAPAGEAPLAGLAASEAGTIELGDPGVTVST
jgi:hypothetical protein